MKTISLITPQLGPAMLALNERQRAFVDAMFAMGAHATYYGAAVKAGYTGSREYLDVQAHRLAHSEKVQTAFREEAERRVVALLPIAHGGMSAILANPSHPDHFKALKHTQGLAGFSPTQKHEVVHKHDAASLKADLLAAMDLLKSMTGPMIDVTPIENHSQVDTSPKQDTLERSPPEEDWTAV